MRMPKCGCGQGWEAGKDGSEVHGCGHGAGVPLDPKSFLDEDDKKLLEVCATLPSPDEGEVE